MRESAKSRFKEEYRQLRADHASRQEEKSYVTLEEARANKVLVDWNGSGTHCPSYLGVKEYIDFPLAQLADYIDWTPFFQTWMLAGRYPGILKDPVVGEEASRLYADALRMLDRLKQENRLKAHGVVGFFAANAVGDDVQVFDTDDRKVPLATLHFLRQQQKKAPGLPNFCLADFIAPQESGIKDYIGLFAVTAGAGIEELLDEYKKKHDDYSEIMVKALADRLAEAFAECLHAQVRKLDWGYAADERLTNEELIKEKYTGIRPAPGYPACPDHTEKETLFSLLDVERRTGIRLTESYAMYPASSVSGYYFANPAAKYFGLGKIARDQAEDYAIRRGKKVEDIERWLAPNLGYSV
jgi:5-methyltetrahydrofolate--homocysteine methyltransferase